MDRETLDKKVKTTILRETLVKKAKITILKDILRYGITAKNNINSEDESTKAYSTCEFSLLAILQSYIESEEAFNQHVSRNDPTSDFILRNTDLFVIEKSNFVSSYLFCCMIDDKNIRPLYEAAEIATKLLNDHVIMRCLNVVEIVMIKEKYKDLNFQGLQVRY